MEKEITEILQSYDYIKSKDISILLDCLNLNSIEGIITKFDFRFTAWQIPVMNIYLTGNKYDYYKLAVFTGKKVDDMFQFLFALRPYFVFLCCSKSMYRRLVKVLNDRNYSVYEIFENGEKLPPFFYHRFDKETKTKVNIIVL